METVKANNKRRTHVERTNIPSDFTNNPYGGILWPGSLGSILNNPGSQSANNQLAMLQGGNVLHNAYQQLVSSAQAQQRYKDLASIFSTRILADNSNYEMAIRSQDIERRIDETGKVFDGSPEIIFWNSEGKRYAPKLWDTAEDRINQELDKL